MLVSIQKSSIWWIKRFCLFKTYLIPIGICTLRYMEWLANDDLLYSTGNSTQYSVIICGKRVWKRMDVCTCITESLCCTEEIYMYNWITLLYSRNDHNLINQLYFKQTLKNEKKNTLLQIKFQNDFRQIYYYWKYY